MDLHQRPRQLRAGQGEIRVGCDGFLVPLDGVDILHPWQRGSGGLGIGSAATARGVSDVAA